MKKEKTERMSFCIYSFMTEELLLGGAELLCFAVIYSFTKGTRGLFHGSQDYLARVCGISVSSVKRSLAKLLAKQYIMKCTVSNLEGYRAIVTEQAPEPPKEDVPSNEAEETLPKKEFLDKYNLKPAQLIARDAPKPKYVFHLFGKHGIVGMTAEQYKRLLSLVSSDQLSAYITKLELLIKDQGYRTFSPYKTIKNWIKEDASL